MINVEKRSSLLLTLRPVVGS